MQNEFVERVIRRSVHVLKRAGKIPDITVDGKEVSIKHTSPLARAQDQDDLVALNQYLATVGQLGPEILNLGTKVEDVPQFVATKLGIEQALIRDEGERMELQQAAQQQMTQMQEQQAGATGPA